MSDITCQACRRDIDCADIRSKLQDIANAHQKYLDARKANDHVHAQRTWLDREALLDGLVDDDH